MILGINKNKTSVVVVVNNTHNGCQIVPERSSEDDDSLETNQCEYGNCQKCPQSIRQLKLMLACPGATYFLFGWLSGILGRKWKRERERSHSEIRGFFLFDNIYISNLLFHLKTPRLRINFSPLKSRLKVKADAKLFCFCPEK